MKLGRVLLAACLFLTLVAHAQGGTIPRYTSVSFEVATTGAESAATVFVEESLAGRFSVVQVREFSSSAYENRGQWTEVVANSEGGFEIAGSGHHEIRFGHSYPNVEFLTVWIQRVYVPYPNTLEAQSEGQPSVQDLAEAHLPVLVFDSDERYLPQSLDEILAMGESADESIKVPRLSSQSPGEVAAGPDFQRFLAHNGHPDYALRFHNPDVSCSLTDTDCDPVFYRFAERDPENVTVYYDSSIEDGSLYLTYYYFYAFDPKVDGPSSPGGFAHVYDRESVTIRLERDEQEGGAYSPVSITYPGHLEQQDMEFNGCGDFITCQDPAEGLSGNDIEYLGWGGGKTSLQWSQAIKVGRHPVLYLALGSHAVFPALGWYTVVTGNVIQGLKEPAGGVGDGALVISETAMDLLPLDFEVNDFLSFSGSWIDVSYSLFDITLELGRGFFPPFIRTPYGEWLDSTDESFSSCLAAPASSANCQAVNQYFQSVFGLENLAVATFRIFDSLSGPALENAQIQLFENGELLEGETYQTNVFGEYTAIWEPDPTATYTFSIEAVGYDSIEGNLGQLSGGSISTENVFLSGESEGEPETAPEVLINGSITEPGQLVEYEFELVTGQAALFRVTDVTDGTGSAFRPEVWLYAPDGTLVRDDNDGVTVELDCGPSQPYCQLDQTGVYRLVIGDFNSADIGDYAIRFVDVSQTNENGSLTNDGVVTGDITLGDLDSFVFTADGGQAALIRVTDVTDGTGSSFRPEVWLYAPDGTLVGYDNDGVTVELDCGPSQPYCQLDQTGVYRLVIGDFSSADIGEYEVLFTGPEQMPMPGTFFSLPFEAGALLPIVTQDYSCGSCGVAGQHHVGIDLVPSGADFNVYSAAAGTVVDVVSSCGNGDTTCNHGFGNTVIVEHPGQSKFSLYAHMQPGSVAVTNGDNVSKGELIGVMGETGNVTGPHLHFEISENPGLGEFGYSASHPSGSGYFDPWREFEDLAIQPTAIEIVNPAGVFVRSGPDVAYPIVTEFQVQHRTVAFAQVTGTDDDTWYRVSLPCRDGVTSCAGWVAGFYLGDTYSTPSDDIPRVRVQGTGTDGLSVRTATVVSADTAFDKVWDDQVFGVSDVSQVVSGSGCVAEWYQIDLPLASSFSQGWICGDFVHPLD